MSTSDPRELDDDMLEALRDLGRPSPLRDDDEARAHEALSAFHAQRTRARLLRWSAAAATAAAALAAVVLAWSSAPTMTWTPQPTGGNTVARGVLMADGVRLQPGDTVPEGVWVRAAGPACLRTERMKSCVTDGTGVRVHGNTMEVEGGTLESRGYGIAFHGETRVVADGGAFVLDARSDHPDVVVVDGPVEVRRPPENVATLPPEAPAPQVAPADVTPAQPSQPAKTNTPRRRPAPAPGELLAEARKQLASGDRRAALASYRRLQRTHPRSNEARAAHVSIGKLELRRGRSKSALNAFTAYLASGGTLAEEAHWGKIQALHRLGRTDKRDAAIESLRSAFPNSVYVGQARALSRGH